MDHADKADNDMNWYEHISGSTDGKNSSHTHHIAYGSTTHSHFHTGSHVHEREARNERKGLKTQIQTGYHEHD